MKPKRTDLLHSDASDRERAVLNRALAKEVSAGLLPVPRVSVAAARRGAIQVEVNSERDTTRLLFISRDTTLLNQTTQSLDGYVDLSDVFDEVHIVILQPGIKTNNPVLRVAPNVWIYVASARHWWWTPYAALRLIEMQLHFADGFRPDLVVARDSYESALVAYWVGRRHGRPTQLHIMEDPFDKRVATALEHARLRRRLARFLIPRFPSIRTGTDQIMGRISRMYPAISDVATLPRFHNYDAETDKSSQRNLKEKYRQFSFLVMYVGPLDVQSCAYQAMDAVRSLLGNKKVGFVVVGDGPGRAELEKRAGLLGITPQVVFERDVEDIDYYIAAADVLVVPDTSAAADDIAIKGAFAKVPLVLVTNALRSDVFTHGESALLCGAGDSIVLGGLLRQVLNDIRLRASLPAAAFRVVTERFHEDPVIYRLAYRDSVESAMFVGDADNVSPVTDVLKTV